MSLDWMHYAECRNYEPEIWFPDEHSGPYRGRRAIDICNICPVKAACLAYARSRNEKYGIWGGVYISRVKKQ